MQRRIKQLLFLLSVALLLTVCAAAEFAVGTPIGRVLSTDIRAFYDGYEIPAYNVDGSLCVAAEDLRGYGFLVDWDGEARRLSLTKTGDVTAPLPTEPSARPVGTVVAHVLYTDIVTILDGVPVQSCNIGGRTMIPFSALEVYGTREYNNDTRTSSLILQGAPNVTLSALPTKVVHAGGAIEGYLGSNSLEALNASYAAGYRCFEMDFLLSSDGHPVALHDWANTYSASLSDQPISLAEFESIRIYGRFTPMTLQSVCAFLTAHPDAYILTDVKDDNLGVLTKIAAEHPEILPQLLPQIYSYAEYAPVRALGYSNIILTCYRLPTYNEKADAVALSAFAKAHGLLAVTADATLAKEGYVRTFRAAGVPLCIHTVNDADEQQAYYDLGVSCIYTDYAN